MLKLRTMARRGRGGRRPVVGRRRRPRDQGRPVPAPHPYRRAAAALEHLPRRHDAGRPPPGAARDGRRARAPVLPLHPASPLQAGHRRLGPASLRLRRLRPGHRLEALPRPLLHQAPLGAGRPDDHLRDGLRDVPRRPPLHCARRATASSSRNARMAEPGCSTSTARSRSGPAISGASVALLVVDDSCRVSEASLAACRLLGLGRDDVLERALPELLAPAAADRLRARLGPVSRDGRPRRARSRSHGRTRRRPSTSA